MKNRTSLQRICAMFALMTVLLTMCTSGQAATPTIDSAKKVSISGRVYGLDTNGEYRIDNAKWNVNTNEFNSYGTVSIQGIDSPIVADGKKNNVPAYHVQDGHIRISYNISSRVSKKTEDWLIDQDKGRKVNRIELDDQIKSGAMILQRSIDHKNWTELVKKTDVFQLPVKQGTLWETTDIEMINGCYYRLIVAYKQIPKAGNKSDSRCSAEVYEFYVVNDNEQLQPVKNTNRYALGKTVQVADSGSYTGEKPIEKNDLHYGWKLGQFYVTGYTAQSGDKDQPVFLKNVGDVVTLWFNLEQDIKALNNDEKLWITPDTDGYDQYFQTEASNCGHGILIIRKTDHENVKGEPVLYRDFLFADTQLGANTRVELLEEGDYEVALDYEVQKQKKVSPPTRHYRIFFKFSVRNANCMVYPMDVKTGEELTNSSVTHNGFRLDLAKSRYLNIFIRKEILSDSADGLVEDTRFNTAAREGKAYTEDGIYVITVQNRYTNQETVKKIYVGENPVLMAHLVTGYTIPEITKMVSQGAVIEGDGTLIPPQKMSAAVTAQPGQTLVIPTDTINDQSIRTQTEQKEKTIQNWLYDNGVILAAIIGATIVAVTWIRKHSKKEEKK